MQTADGDGATATHPRLVHQLQIQASTSSPHHLITSSAASPGEHRGGERSAWVAEWHPHPRACVAFPCSLAAL